MRCWRVRALSALVVLVSACGTARFAPTSVCGPQEGVVTRVLDGDTIELDDGTTIRYLHVDTPEIARYESEEDECFALEAKRLNEELVLGQTVRLEYDMNCTDAYARTLAFVIARDRMVNRILIERGYGELLIMKPNLSRESEFIALEKQARDNNAGLWGACQ